ncbi:MAG: hypothetical protein ACHBNF_01360 [Chromatiales bacterium]
MFFLDAYGGYDAFRIMRDRTRYDGYTYVWHQAAYNPIAGEGRCHIDFKFDDGSVPKRVFSYDWASLDTARNPRSPTGGRFQPAAPCRPCHSSSSSWKHFDHEVEHEVEQR